MNIRTYFVCNGVKIKATAKGITVTSPTGEKTYFDADGKLIKNNTINLESKNGIAILECNGNQNCRNIKKNHGEVCAKCIQYKQSFDKKEALS